MTIISHAFPFTYKRKPAQMRVIRNDGFCWGRMAVDWEGTDDTVCEYDVSTARDHYERTDEEAAQAFINAARRGKWEKPVASWRIGRNVFEGR